MKTKFFLLLMASGLATATHAQTRDTLNRHVTHSSLHGQQEKISSYEDGKHYDMTLKRGNVTAFSIDGKDIPASEWNRYTTVMNRLREQMDRGKAQAVRDRQQAQRDREQAARDREQAERDRQQAERDRQQAIKDKAQANMDRQQAMRDRQQADSDRVQAEKDRVLVEKDRAEAALDRQQLKLLTDDLVKDKIISSPDSLQNLIMENGKLSVNGVTQPDDVSAKYTSRYTRFAAARLEYSRDINSVHMNVHRN